MATHPYIPLYVDDYDAATAHLSPAEDGVYGRLMRLCWRTPGCSLPNDTSWIARKIRLSAKEFATIGQPVLDEFFTLQRGRLVQKRLKAEYDDISRKKSARQQAGKKGGEAKARKTHENPASIATVLPLDTRASPEPYPDPEDNPPNPPGGGAIGKFFEQGWNAYPEAGRGNHGPDQAAAEWTGAARRAGGEDRLLAAVRRRAEWLAAHPAERVKAFHRWLRDGGFMAYLPADLAVVIPWSGPAEVWLAVVTAKDEAFARSWLADCAWQEAPVKAVVSNSPTALSRLRQEVGPVLSSMGIQILEKAA